MSHRISRATLPVMSPGVERAHLVHRFGAPGARPKAYLQAGIHADEIPGLLVLHHLLGRLIAADAAGAIAGEVIVVPFANPIGLGQRLRGELLGRFEFDGGENFNRNFPDLAETVAERVAGRLGDVAEANVAIVREALVVALAERAAVTELDGQRLALTRLAIDADIVLDLHCDSESVMHLFVARALWPAAADLSAQIGSRVTMLADYSGGQPFDETFSRPWSVLAERFGARHPVPPACLAATVELRGSADVDDGLAEADARNLFRVLQRRGVVAGDPGPLPEPLCEATPFEGVGHVVAPAPGIVAYRRHPGDRVEKGEVVADLVDPTAEDPASARTPLLSPTAGILFGRDRLKFARPGNRVCKIAGADPLPGREPGKLMTD